MKMKQNIFITTLFSILIFHFGFNSTHAAGAGISVGAGVGGSGSPSDSNNLGGNVIWKRAGVVGNGEEVTLYLQGSPIISGNPTGTTGRPATFGCGNINLIVNGDAYLKTPILQDSASPQSNFVIWASGNGYIDNNSYALDFDNPNSGTPQTFGNLQNSGGFSSGLDSNGFRMDASFIGTSDTSTFGPTQNLIMPVSNQYNNLGTFLVNGMLATGAVKYFKTTNSSNQLAGFQPKFNYTGSALQTNPPQSLRVILPQSQMMGTVTSSTVEYTDMNEALRVVGAQ
ncbi:MAG: hypothetical protein J0L93_08000 [Deltaproteobacteria bacterium]|nr:hypothetical protein [Deltaproteobacteria bacterium]